MADKVPLELAEMGSRAALVGDATVGRVGGGNSGILEPASHGSATFLGASDRPMRTIRSQFAAV